MEGLNKKSNSELQELKQKLSLDFEIVRRELFEKTQHWLKIEETYKKVNNELKKRGVV